MLIIIAVAISIIVFEYLRTYVRNDKIPQCNEDVNLIIYDATCTYNPLTASAVVSFVLSNKGLWNISSAYIKMGLPEREIKNITLLLGVPFPEGDLASGQFTLINTPVKISNPGSGKDYEVQIEPLQRTMSGDNPLCKGAIITYPIRCASI